MSRTLQDRLMPAQSPTLRLYTHYAGASMKRMGMQWFVSAVVMVLILAVTGMGGHPHRPMTAVRGEVEVVDNASQHGVVAAAPSVAIIDAVCITNTPTLEPC